MISLVNNLLKHPFIRFLGKKLLFLVITFFFSATLLFIIPRLMPITPVDIMLAKLRGGSSGTSGGVLASQEVLRKVYTEQFGLNQSLTVQYLAFWKRIFTMDYGPSYYRFPIKVFDLVISALPWTLSLIIPVPIIGFLVGNWIGSRIALNKDSKLNKVLFYGSLYTSLLPYYWFALILVFIFAITFRWFPICGAYSSKWVAPVLNFEFFLDATLHWILPFLSLASIGIGGWAMGMRASISYQLQSMYIDYTKRLGFSQDKLRRYMQRVAILPNFTWLPMSFASLVSQTMLVEVVFGYPGLGTLMYQAALSADYPLLEATFMITMIIVLIGNFLCDMIYGILDPTIGSRYVEESAG